MPIIIVMTLVLRVEPFGIKNSHYFSGGSGIRKTRYKNCSMRIYRKVFRKDSKKEIVEGEENADVKDTIDVNAQNIEPVRTSPIRTRMMKPIEAKTDELIYLIDDIDIGNFCCSIEIYIETNVFRQWTDKTTNDETSD